MRWLLAVVLLFLQVAAPDITVDVQPVNPNAVGVIRVTVSNPSTADTLWNARLRIEEMPPSLMPITGEYTLSHELRPGKTDIGELSFQAKREAEGGVYAVTISLSGGVGACQEGCVPFFIEKEVNVKVVRDEPDIVVTHTVEGGIVVLTLRNAGEGRAQNVVCDQSPVGVLSPGEEREVTLTKKGVLVISYEDDYGKKFTETYSIIEKEEETKESHFSFILVVAGFLLYLWRRG